MALGMGFKVNRFQFAYARTIYNTAGGSNHITLTTNIKDFARK